LKNCEIDFNSSSPDDIQQTIRLQKYIVHGQVAIVCSFVNFLDYK